MPTHILGISSIYLMIGCIYTWRKGWVDNYTMSNWYGVALTCGWIIFAIIDYWKAIHD